VAHVAFGFRFYTYGCGERQVGGQTGTAFVGTNGILSMASDITGVTDSSNNLIPNGDPPNHFFAPSWDDYVVKFGLGAADRVDYLTQGAVGNRVFTVEWLAVTRVGGDTLDAHYFQIKLHEADGALGFLYGPWVTDAADDSTIGLEDRSGEAGDCGPNCGNTNKGVPQFNYHFRPALSPPNDDRSEALCIAFDGTVSGDTFDASGIDQSQCAENDHADVWYYFDSPGGPVTFDTCATGPLKDTTLSVSSSTQEINCNDDNPVACGQSGSQSLVTTNTTAGERYWVRVAGYLGQQLDFVLKATSAETPLHDICSDARVLVTDFAVLSSTDDNTGCAQQSSCELLGQPCGDTIDEWLTWTATATGNAIASTCLPGTAFDTTLAVFDACGGNEVAFNDDSDSCWDATFSRVSWPVTEGAVYSIRVAGFNHLHGQYALRLVVNPLFSDDFERGDVSAWTDAIGD